MSKTWSFNIAGVQYHDYKRVLNSIKVGDKLRMIPEPTNKYDPNAVQLHFGNIFLGFVPGKISSDISAFLEYAEEPTCLITNFNKAGKPWEMFTVSITDGVPEEEYEDLGYWEDDTPFPGGDMS